MNHHTDSSEAKTIGLIYELVSAGDNLARGAGWREAIQELKGEVADLRTVANETQRQVGGSTTAWPSR